MHDGAVDFGIQRKFWGASANLSKCDKHNFSIFLDWKLRDAFDPRFTWNYKAPETQTRSFEFAEMDARRREGE